MSTFDEQLEKVRTAPGFLAALDQSGGSTPKALRAYGVEEGAWSNDDEMFALVHEMRTRIITSPAFDGNRVLGAILFENTVDRQIDGMPTARYLWRRKRIVPFLKVDRGLAAEENGVQLMKPILNLDALIEKANANEIFGTKMRSVVKQADAGGIAAIAEQQFEFGRRILAGGPVPILEPEVDIRCPDKAEAEAMLTKELLRGLETLEGERQIMFKLTLPEQDNLYADLVSHPRVVKVVALSGGYSREEANRRLERNSGVVASFSRALVEGLTAQQSDEEFNRALDEAIESIFRASST